ncbi:hypothetical protein LguiB_030421 [Lonicera macranthoides]
MKAGSDYGFRITRGRRPEIIYTLESTLKSHSGADPRVYRSKLPLVLSANLQVKESLRGEKQSYATAVGSRVEWGSPLVQIDVDKLTSPSVKGNEVIITLTESVYQQSVPECRSNVLGRIFFNRGQKFTMEEVYAQVEMLWVPGPGWRMVSIGRGFFYIQFASMEEMHRVQYRSSWNLQYGVLRIMPWQAYFNPKAPRTSHAHVWARITHSGQEYWHPRLILEIAKGIGTPLQLDKAT